jgi:DNA polymerase-1
VNVLLVDGSGLAYRAYYAFARNPLRTSRGEETSVAYAFLTTLWRWLDRYRPARAAVAFDPPGPTHRHRLFAEYKANRPPRPPALAAQMPRLHALLGALRLPVVEIPGWEADDVLATLAVRFAAAGADVRLASADKDFRQLVSERITLVRPSVQAGTDDEMGPAELARAMGLRPAQIVDWLALAGDTSDNVPGVRGVGDKTAAALLRKHGSLAALYAALDAVPQAGLRARLERDRATAELSRALVELRTDAPVAGDWEWPTPDWTALRALLVELEFVQLLRRIPGAERAAPGRAAVAVERLEDGAAVARRVASLEAVPAVAVVARIDEAARPGRIDALALAWDGAHAAVCGCRAPAAAPRPGELALDFAPGAGLTDAECAAAAAPLLEAGGVDKIGYDLKSLLVTLSRLGVAVRGALFDLQIAAYVLDPSRRPPGLGALAAEALGEEVGTDADRVAALGDEAASAWRLRDVLAGRLAAADQTSLFHDVEMPLVPVLAAMEQAGVRVDAARLDALAQSLQGRIDALAEAVYAACGRRLNLNSPQQIGQVLFDELGLPRGRRTQSGYSTDVGVLEKLAAQHEVARLLLEHRALVKLRSNYAEALPRLVDRVTGRIHTRFNQAVVATGRLSSSEPNLQNIPVRSELGREIRAAFVSRHAGGAILSADYSQIELRLLAHLSGDAALAAAFAAAADVHTITAARIFACDVAAVTPAQRAAAKTVNFGVVYGMGARGLAERLGIGRDEARRFIDEYFATYPRVRACTEELVASARRTGVATTMLGRRIRVADLDSPQPALRAAAERIAVNAPIQGSAADLIKVAMVRVHAGLAAAGLRSQLVLQVHDELVFDVVRGEIEAVTALARTAMETALAVSVPLVVDVGVGSSWAEAHR